MKKLFAFVAILLVLVGCGVEYHSKYSNYEHPFYKYKTHQCFVYLGNSNAAVPYVKIKNADTTTH